MAPLACMRPQEPNLCSRVSNTLTIACPPLSPRLLLNLSTVTLALDFFLHLPLYLVLNRSPFVQHQRISWVLLNLPLLRLLGTSPLVLILPHTAVFIILVLGTAIAVNLSTADASPAGTRTDKVPDPGRVNLAADEDGASLMAESTRFAVC